MRTFKAEPGLIRGLRNVVQSFFKEVRELVKCPFKEKELAVYLGSAARLNVGEERVGVKTGMVGIADK